MKRFILLMTILFFGMSSYFYGLDVDGIKVKLDSLYKKSGRSFIKGEGSYLYRQITRSWRNLSESQKNELRPYLLRPDDASGSAAGSYSASDLANLTTYDTTHFKIHYVNDSSSSNAPDLTDSSPADGVPDYVNKMGDYLELVYKWYKDHNFTPTSAGGEPVKSDTAVTNNGGDGKYDIYIMSINAYGMTIAESEDPYTSYIVMNNDFSQFGDEDSAMLVTIFHEFFHAIQYSYNPDIESWWLEATAVFMEDYISIDASAANTYSGADWGGTKDGDTINDYTQYIDSVFNNPYLSLNYDDLTHQYGEVLFVKFLAEKYAPTGADTTKGDGDIIRKIFVDMETNSLSNPLTGIDDVLKNDYNSSLTEAVKTYYRWLYFTGSNNPSTDIGEGLNGKFFEEDDGDDSGDAASAWSGITPRSTHSSYPVELQSVKTEVPYQLAANYIQFLPDSTYGKKFQLEFEGSDKDTADVTAEWYLQMVLLKDGGEMEVKEVTLGSKNDGTFQVSDFGSEATYRKIIMIPVVVSTSTTTEGFRYIYASALGNTSATADNIVSLYNYPNPSTTGNTTIQFEIAKSCYATLTVYDASGHRVKTLITKDDGMLDAGFNPQTVSWDGTNDELKQVGNGVYFYRLVLEKDGEGKIGEKMGKLVILR